MPVRMLLISRRIDMHVVGNIVQYHIDIMLMRRRKKRAELFVRAETLVQTGRINWPITMVAAELRVFLTRVPFITVLELIFAPRVPWILRNRRDPNRVYTQAVEESFFNFLRDACEVSTLIIHNIQNLRRIQLPVILAIAIRKTVNHQRIQHLSFRIMTS